MISNFERKHGKISSDKFTGSLAQREYARDILSKALIAAEFYIDKFTNDLFFCVEGVDKAKIKRYKEQKESHYSTLIQIVSDDKKIKSRIIIDNWDANNLRPGGGTFDASELLTAFGFSIQKKE